MTTGPTIIVLFAAAALALLLASQWQKISAWWNALDKDDTNSASNEAPTPKGLPAPTGSIPSGPILSGLPAPEPPATPAASAPTSPASTPAPATPAPETTATQTQS